MYTHTCGARKSLSTPFTANMKMCDLICDNYSLLLIITRFGIPLGFGDKTISQVCQEHQVDTSTLLLLLNCSANPEVKPPKDQIMNIDINSLLSYLSNSHSYFLDFRLPLLRQQLLSSLSNCPHEVAIVVRNFFDEYVEEVRKHMAYEEKIVFPYARKLSDGAKDDHYSIKVFSKRHDQIELKITELKNLLIKYYPAPSGYELNNVLHDIFTSEADLAAHNLIEDNIFTPYMIEVERRLASPTA
ncbi:MAG: hemerythrin domain-containing protein [Porphyromonadaceae bacterium]|nr:hemerythrin domain-containing protein [Porphyromonadaceae bacterium]